jgi:hypothetical protein
MKTLLKLIIAAAIVHATVRAGVSYFHYYRFKDVVHHIAQFSGRASENELQNRVVQAAGDFEIPLNPGRVSVRREENHTLIDASYDDRIELLPRFYLPWKFNVSVNTYTLVPKEAQP